MMMTIFNATQFSFTRHLVGLLCDAKISFCFPPFCVCWKDYSILSDSHNDDQQQKCRHTIIAETKMSEFYKTKPKMDAFYKINQKCINFFQQQKCWHKSFTEKIIGPLLSAFRQLLVFVVFFHQILLKRPAARTNSLTLDSIS